MIWPYHLGPRVKFRKPGPAISAFWKKLPSSSRLSQMIWAMARGAMCMALAPAMAKEEA